MISYRSAIRPAIALALLTAPPVSSQTPAVELDELRRRVAVLRAALPQITTLAEKFVPMLGNSLSGRLVISRLIDPSFYSEFNFRAAGPPDTRNADENDVAGLAILSIRHWEGNGIGVAARVEQYRSQGRPVVIIAPAIGRPDQLLPGSALIDDGAPDGARVNASINGVANMIAAWTFYNEIVAAATRAGWQPGVLMSVMRPGATAFNERMKFRLVAPAPSPIASGTLGAAFLDAVDTMLATAGSDAHRAQVDSVAAQLRAMRGEGRTLFAGSCGHYLHEEIPHDAISGSPFIAIGESDDNAAPGTRAPRRDDVVLWFGYGGYDCPNASVADRFQSLGLRVVVISNNLPADAAANILAQIRLAWQLPDGAVALPFAPGRVAPMSSVEMATYYLWLRRLLSAP